MSVGLCLNLSVKDSEAAKIELPTQPLFISSQGPVIEILFWSSMVKRWIHGVANSIDRVLPKGHVQVTVGDLAWIKRVVKEKGVAGLRECIEDLELDIIPDEEI